MASTIPTDTQSLFTQIRVAIMSKDSLRGLATVKVADAVYLTGIRIIEGQSGLFIAMPSRKTKAGEYADIFFPASKSKRDELQAAVLAQYHKEMADDKK
jgi:stage V sporulation protein G